MTSPAPQHGKPAVDGQGGETDLPHPAATLRGLLHHSVVRGRDERPCRVWRDPVSASFADALRRADPLAVPGLRALLTEAGLFLWQSVHLLHADFERATGLSGVRVMLGPEMVRVNDEVVAQPECFPWLFPDGLDPEIEARRAFVAGWLTGHTTLRAIHPTGFTVTWYS